MHTGDPRTLRTRASILAFSVAVAGLGLSLPVRQADALFGGFNPFNPSSYAGVFKDMLKTVAGVTGDVFVGSMKIAGKSVKVMLDFAQIAAGVMAVPPFDFARDGMSRMLEISMRVAREMMRQDPGLMEFMTIWGFKSYEMMANAFPGHLEDEVLGEMFLLLLENDLLTKEMLWHTQHNKGLALLMNRIAGKNRALRHKLVAKMAKDKGLAGSVLSLAIRYPFLAHTLCGKMDDPAFTNFSRVIADSVDNARKVGTIFSRICKAHPDQPPPLLRVMRHLGSTTDNNDGNEAADERTIYGMFRDLTASHRFLDGVERLAPEIQAMMMNTLFLGEGDDENGEPILHHAQAFLNAYAMARGMQQSVLPHYDTSLPPDPDSDNPANALVGRMLPMLVYHDKNGDPHLTAWGWQFVQGLITGAYLYDDEPCHAVLDFLGGILPPMDMPQPDPSAPAPRDFLGRLAKADTRQDTKSGKPVEAVQFGYQYLHQPLYSHGSDDAWLLMPEWIAPATWYRTDDSKRDLDEDRVYTELRLDRNKEHLVFLVVPFDATYPTWALAEGFTPMYGHRFECEQQTGFRLFGKRVPRGTGKLELMGNGDGSHNYVFAVMEESTDNVYTYARDLLQESELLNEKANWLYTLDHKKKDAHFYEDLVQGEELGNWGANDGDGWDIRGMKGGRLWLHASPGHEDIVRVLSLENRDTKQHFAHAGKRVLVDAPKGYRIIGWFDSDNDARDSYGNKGNPHIAIAVKEGYEDAVKLVTLGGKVQRYEVLPGYRPVGWWKVDGDSMDSFGRRTSEGWMSLQIRPLDARDGQPNRNAYDPGLNYAAWYTDRHLRIEDVPGGSHLLAAYLTEKDGHFYFNDVNAAVVPNPDLLAAWLKRGKPGIHEGKRHPENPLEMAAYLYLNATRADNYMGRHVIDAINKEKDDGKYRNPFGDERRFVMRLTGRLEVPETGDYAFGVDGDNAVEVRIDGRRVTGWYGEHGNRDEAREVRTIHLERGYHLVEFIGEDLYDFDLYWRLPSMEPDAPLVPVSDQRFSHPRYDADLDGVADAFDRCPDSVPGIPVERNGCAPYGHPYTPEPGDGFGGTPLPPPPSAGSPGGNAPGSGTGQGGGQGGGGATAPGGGSNQVPNPPIATPASDNAWLIGWTPEPDSDAVGVPPGYRKIATLDVHGSHGDGFDHDGKSARRMLTFAIRGDEQIMHGDIVRFVNVEKARDRIDAAGKRTRVAALDGYHVIAFLELDGDRVRDSFNQKDNYTTLQVKEGYEPYVRLVRIPGPEAQPADGRAFAAKWKLRRFGIDSNGTPLEKGDWVALEVAPLPANAGGFTGGEYENGLLASTWRFGYFWDAKKGEIRKGSRHPQTSTDFDKALQAIVQDKDLLYGTFKLDRIDNDSHHGFGNPFGDDGDFVTWLAGRIRIPADGTYTFAIDGDDAVEVRIDGKVVTHWLDGHGMKGEPVQPRSLYLRQGLHSIQFLHEERGGDEGYRLYWKRPGADQFTVVPAEAFSHAVHDQDLDGIDDLDDRCPDTLPGSGGIGPDGCVVTRP
ncbi:MAG: hypothetical protein D6721_08225 [Gammaproteobacteria bacterium]|nr:MAG: hypothetical protein D6721_08225 [Gammaproteobacteria bacterium]